MKKIIIILLCITFFNQKTFAWGRTGHSIVLKIAFQYLDKNDKEILLKYIDKYTINQAASWMDDVRDEPKFTSLKKLHYINIEKGAEINVNSTDNILSELQNVIEKLKKGKELSDSIIQIQLFELIHLVGDLHQPLHVGYGADKGGNDYQIQYKENGTNLHKMWDSEIIESTFFINSSTVIEDETDIEINILNWLIDTRKIIENIYPINHKINDDYIKNNVPIVSKQLHKAGYRLSLILHEYLKNLNPNPVFKYENIEAKEITNEQINSNINNKVKLTTKVFSVKKIGKNTFLNCGADYPNNPITIVIKDEDLVNFKINPETYFVNRKITITGKIILYKEKPEIILQTPEAIKIVD